MKSIKKILVPTDFSENAEPAYRHAQEIAHCFGAKVDFIHVIPTLQYFSESMASIESPLDIGDQDLYPRAQQEAQHKLEKLMSDYLAEESRGEFIVRIERKPSEMISNYAKKNNYDLIVMGSKGRHESALLRGSTTDKVIRYSDVPVFNVDERLSSHGLKRILFPTDGSPVSFSALPLALTLADVYEAEITLYHVEELYGSPLDYKSRDPEKSSKSNIYEALIDHLEDYLVDENVENVQISRGNEDFEDQFVVTEGASSQRINFHTVIEKGVTAHLGISEYASEHADVVVMATHGHSGLAHFFLGSTTEKVAQSLDLPVLTVKPDEQKLANNT
jgi:nucleotide-binding universal stress UspA family protein